MNERQPYEQHLAEKMQQLPLPLSTDRAWEKMKVLLDDELPRGSGSGGNGRWWILGIIAGMLITGAWIFNRQKSSENEIAARKPTAVDKSSNASTQWESIAKLPPTTSPADPAYAMDAADQSNSSGKRSARTNTDAARMDQSISMIRKQKIPGKKLNGGSANSDVDIGQHPQPLNPISKNNKKLPAYTENFTQQTLIERIQPNSSEPVDIIQPSLPIETSQLLPDGKMKPLLYRQTILKQELAARIKPVKKINKHAADPDRVFSVGLSLPLAFPLADQQALGYNFRGGSNTVSDYIPSPHLQYHLNKKTFLQTEIQIVSPQFIRPLLMYQQKTITNPNTYLYNSVYARKLYYFNLPVSVYHSPMPHFYLGTGLQFSSLMSGVAMYENKTVNGNQQTILRQHFNRINFDSLTNRMNSAEMRLLVDVNYYWQRFTVGLRYNQAFGNYASFRLDNTTGFTYDKNKALFFYLRYNIWEDKKRKMPARTMLSLK